MGTKKTIIQANLDNLQVEIAVAVRSGP
jgi:hypothetical protein